jgi:hypothetical protein
MATVHGSGEVEQKEGYGASAFWGKRHFAKCHQNELSHFPKMPFFTNNDMDSTRNANDVVMFS